MQEKELVQKIQSGDPSAFKELFEMYNSLVYNICCRMTGNLHEGEDITQEVFLNAYKAFKNFRSDSKLSTWLYRIAINQCLNYQSKKKREKWLSLDFFSESDDIQLQTISADENTPDKILERKETESIIQNAINSLPERQRISLMLHRYEGLSYEEISKILECSVSSVESLIFRGKQNLCKKLIPYLKHI